jgi:signal transduction histidine kinase
MSECRHVVVVGGTESDSCALMERLARCDAALSFESVATVEQLMAAGTSRVDAALFLAASAYAQLDAEATMQLGLAGITLLLLSPSSHCGGCSSHAARSGRDGETIELYESSPEQLACAIRYEIALTHERKQAARSLRRSEVGRAMLAGFASASSCDELARVLLEGVAALGFAESALWLAEGSELLLLHARGCEEQVHGLACVSLDARTSPLAQSVILQRALWSTERVAHADRDLSASSVHAAVPLLASPRPLGVLGLLSDSEEELDLELRTLCDELCSACARSMERALRGEEIGQRLREEQLLLAVTSHDLRSPLQMIALGSELFESRRQLDNADLRLIRQVRDSARRGTQLVEQLLDFSKVRLSGADARLQRGDVFELLRTAVADFRVRSPECPIALHLEGDGELPLDRDAVVQVLHNLLANAAQYREPGTAVRVRGEGLRDRVYLEVNNRGSAIDQQQLSDLFAPMKRGQTRGERGSLGLGLHIVQRLVTAHGGSVWARSDPRDGTTFVVQLPRAARQARPDAAVPGRFLPSSPVSEPYRGLLAALEGQPHAALLAHWLALGGATHLPHPRQLDRAQLLAMLPDLLRVEVLEDRAGSRRFRYKEVGGALERRLRGRSLGGSWVAPARSPLGNGLAESYERCAQARRPVFDYVRSGPSRAEEESFQRLLLPFSSDGEHVTHLIGLATFSGFDKAMGDELEPPVIIDGMTLAPTSARMEET